MQDMNHFFNIKYIFLLVILISYNIRAANLKESLIELAQTSDLSIAERILTTLIHSQELESLEHIEFTSEQMDGVFVALSKLNCDDTSELFFKLLVPASKIKGSLKHAMVLIADYLGRWDVLPESARTALRTIENQLYITRIYSHFLDYSSDVQDFTSLFTILESKAFEEYWKKFLLSLIPSKYFDAFLKSSIGQPNTFFLQVLDAERFLVPHKNTVLALVYYITHIDLLPEATRNALKNDTYQRIIRDLFIAFVDQQKEISDIQSLITVLEWKDFDPQYRKLILHNFITVPRESDLRQHRLNTILPYLYKTELEQFSRMVFTHQAHQQNSEKNQNVFAKPKIVICNQEGYDEGVSIDCEKGHALKLDENTPIGYNVYLPEGEVKAIFTQVYGGNEARLRKEFMYLPGVTEPLDRFLLANGIAVVTLNLVDLRELKDHQSKMPQDLDERIHASINRYFNVFKDPHLLKALHPELGVLENLPNFLFGASFGGLTVVRHAQRFQGTFAGYLSFDGGLHFSVMDSTNAAIAGYKKWSSEESGQWLDPIHEVEKIRDPVLLLHNMDDNNVSPAVSIAFYRTALEKNKELARILRLLLTEQGNPIPVDEEKIYNKGHFLPTQPERFQRLADYVLQFIVDGLSALPLVSELRAHMHKRRGYELHSAHGLLLSSPNHLWLSELFQHYYRLKQPKLTDQVWDKELEPILQSVFLVCSHNLDIRHKNTSFIEWKIAQVKDMFSEQHLVQVLLGHAQGFADYLCEKYSWTIDASELAHTIVHNKALQEIFKTWIVSLPNSELTPTFTHYLLYQLLRGIPDFAAYLAGATYDNLSQEDQVSVTNQLDEIRTAFINDIAQSEAIALSTWQQAAAAIKADSKRFNKIIPEISTPSMLDHSRILAGFQELLALAHSPLNTLASTLAMRAAYRKLLEGYEHVEQSACATHRSLALLSLGLMVGNKDFMKESIVKAREALQITSSHEKSTSVYLNSLWESLSIQNRPFTDEEFQEFKELTLR